MYHFVDAHVRDELVSPVQFGVRAPASRFDHVCTGGAGGSRREKDSVRFLTQDDALLLDGCGAGAVCELFRVRDRYSRLTHHHTGKTEVIFITRKMKHTLHALPGRFIVQLAKSVDAC